MDFIQWRDDYSVNVLQLDAQHKHLVGMINGLAEIMERGSKPEDMTALLEDLIAYTSYHFATEEKMMERAGYIGLAEHRRKHAAMKAEVMRFNSASAFSNATTPMKLMTFLKTWLIKHINVTDKLYVPTLVRAGVDQGSSAFSD